MELLEPSGKDWYRPHFLTKPASETSPCHIIMKRSGAASHHNRVFFGNPASSPSTVTQCKGFSTCNKEKMKTWPILKTWHNLGSEFCCIMEAAKQHDGVGKRWWNPSHMSTSCRAVEWVLYCVTRAPLLYFIRSWVALSFKVSESVSEASVTPVQISTLCNI